MARNHRRIRMQVREVLRELEKFDIGAPAQLTRLGGRGERLGRSQRGDISVEHVFDTTLCHGRSQIAPASFPLIHKEKVQTAEHYQAS
jgi:hypothetical protein